QDRGDQDFVGEVQLLLAVLRRDTDHGGNPVGVDQVGPEEGERERVGPGRPQGGGQFLESGGEYRALTSVRLGCGPVLAQAAQRDDREDGPPDAGGEQTDPYGGGLADPEGIPAEIEGELQREREPATEVADGPPTGGDAVAFV